MCLHNTSARSMSRTTLFATTITILLLPLLTGCGTAQARPTDSATSQAPAGIVYRKTYDSTVQYSANDAVTYQRSTYVALQATINVPPVGSPQSAAKWSLLAGAGDNGLPDQPDRKALRSDRPGRAARASRQSWPGSNLLLSREKVFCAGG